MMGATGGGHRRDGGSRRSRLFYNGDERKYELWETKFLGHLRLLGLKSAFLDEPVTEQDEKYKKDTNKQAYAELIQVLDDRSLSLVRRGAAEDGRKALQILRQHYTGVQMSSLSSGLGLNQEITKTPQIKEEPEEQSVKQEEEQLPVSVPEASVVCVKREESPLLEQRQTEHQSQEEDISSEPYEGHTEHSSDTDNDDEWESFSCASARSTGLFPKYKSVPEISPSVNDEDLSGSARAEAKKHQCSICNKRFGEKKILQRHVRVHTGERPYRCTVCEKTFTQNGNLERHMKTHTGERPYSCSVCKRTFTQQSTLTVHERTHTDDKPFSCAVCGATFNQSGHLTSHMRTHTGEKPYICSVCKRTFAYQRTLAVHERTHNGDKPYGCSVCESTFTQSSHLQRHIRSHTGEKPFSCTVCKKSFVDKRGLKAHMGLKHI